MWQPKWPVAKNRAVQKRAMNRSRLPAAAIKTKSVVRALAAVVYFVVFLLPVISSHRDLILLPLLLPNRHSAFLPKNFLPITTAIPGARLKWFDDLEIAFVMSSDSETS